MQTQVNIDGKTYTIDEFGNISKRRGTGFLKCFPDKDGYIRVTVRFSREHTYNEALHRVMYRAWYGEIPDGMTVDHIDNDRSNNHKDNLQLMTAEDNAAKGNAEFWIITSPQGVEEEVYNLAEYCRKNDLHSSHIVTDTYKGWKARKKDDES